MPIEVKNVSYTYSAGSAVASTAVKDVSFTLNDGDFAALVGHTGSGKSTLVQHLNGLLKPTSGQILVDGVDLNGEKTDRRAIRQRVGLVFQYPEYQLFEETIEKDIGFGPKNQGLSEEEIKQRVKKAMAQVELDYDSLAQRSPFDLSGGQMRRVAIAGVLAMQPSFLILDEPTAGLDPKGRESILNMVRQLHRQGNVTIVMVSHSMDDVARLAQRVLVMSRGQLVADCSPRELFQKKEMLESIGLGVPEASRLCALLRARGIEMPDDLYTQEELMEHILRLWKGAGAC